MKDTLAFASTVAALERTTEAIAVAGTPAATNEVFELRPDQIVRLEKSAQIACLEVKAGIVWLTATPAQGDVILSAGDKFVPGDHGPFIVQALGAASLSFKKATAKQNGRHPIQRLPMMPFQSL